MDISLTSNSVTEWVAKFLPIKSDRRAVMVIVEGCPGCLPVLDPLGFTVDKIYYGGKKIVTSTIYDFPRRFLLWHRFLVVLIGDGDIRILTVVLVQV